jgi:hypothetical protein
MIILELANYRKEIERLESYDNQPDTRFAWLADYPDADDEAHPVPKVGQQVGLIEMDREYNGDNLNIYPYFSGLHIYDPARDGIMKPIGLQNPFWQYFNLAVGPGIQKWYPRYRHGEAYNIDYEKDTCSVSVNPAIAQGGDGLYINARENLFGVPIVYKDCNADPFQDNDSVVIEFGKGVDGKHDWAKPKVIGFKTNPKPCDSGELVFVSLGEMGFIWDLKIDTYWETLPNIQLETDCISALSGKTETTKNANNFTMPMATKSFPYKKMFRRMNQLPTQPDFTYNYVTLGLEPLAPDESCGEIMLNKQLSYTCIEDPPNILTYTWTFDPVTCLFGELQPARVDMRRSGNFPELYEKEATQPRLGTYLSCFWFIDYVCPIDHKTAYFSKCIGAEYENEIIDYDGFTPTNYGNEPINIANNGFRYSDNTLVQIFYNVYAHEVSHGSSPIIYDPRVTVALAGCCTYPFNDPLDPPETEPTLTNPILQPKNDLFSQAVYDLIEGLYTHRRLTHGEPRGSN